MIASTPAPPYYAVVFTSQRAGDDRGYDAMAQRLAQRAAAQPGYLGMESARGADGFGITVSYWSSLEAIAAWKADAEHLHAQARGPADWYTRYAVRVSRVERAYTHDPERSTDAAPVPGKAR